MTGTSRPLIQIRNPVREAAELRLLSNAGPDDGGPEDGGPDDATLLILTGQTAGAVGRASALMLISVSITVPVVALAIISGFYRLLVALLAFVALIGVQLVGRRIGRQRARARDDHVDGPRCVAISTRQIALAWTSADGSVASDVLPRGRLERVTLAVTDDFWVHGGLTTATFDFGLQQHFAIGVPHAAVAPLRTTLDGAQVPIVVESGDASDAARAPGDTTVLRRGRIMVLIALAAAIALGSVAVGVTSSSDEDAATAPLDAMTACASQAAITATIQGIAVGRVVTGEARRDGDGWLFSGRVDSSEGSRSFTCSATPPADPASRWNATVTF